MLLGLAVSQPAILSVALALLAAELPLAVITLRRRSVGTRSASIPGAVSEA